MKSLYIITLSLTLLLSGCSTAGPSDNGDAKAELMPKGSTLTVNNVDFIVKNMEETKEYNGKVTENKLIILEVSAKNNGKKEAAVTSDMFYLLDDKGREYKGETYSYDNGYFGITDPIAAGLSRQAVVGFEVPTDSLHFALAIADNMFDFGGAEYKYVDLE